MIGVWAPEGMSLVTTTTTTGDVVVYVFLSLGDGRISRVEVEREFPWVRNHAYIARTGALSKECDDYHYDKEPVCGRPLGLVWHTELGLLVADAYYGLLLVSKEQCLDLFPSIDRFSVESLVDQYEGKRFMFSNALVLDSKGEHVYFTDSSQLYQRRDVMRCLYDGRGKICRPCFQNEEAHSSNQKQRAVCFVSI